MAPRTAPNSEFELMLTGGHPNSLGRTVEVVDIVLADRSRLIDLYSCYFSDDEVVRLRVSNAMKRVAREHPDWLLPLVDPLLDEVAGIHQASTQWTLATLFQWLWDQMNARQKARAKKLLMSNLEEWDDWIVLNNSMEALAEWSAHDASLKQWLVPRLEALQHDGRRSVARRAGKLLVRTTRC
jgi:hypothetical protein